MTIIHANLDHLDLLLPLFDGYRVFYEKPSDLERARHFLQERLEAQDSIIFLAQEAGRGLGFTQLYPTFSSVSMERFYILNDIYVHPEHRNRGIGGQLLDHAKAMIADRGLKGLSLETANDNPAQTLYEKKGWEKDTDFLHYFWTRGKH